MEGKGRKQCWEGVRAGTGTGEGGGRQPAGHWGAGRPQAVNGQAHDFPGLPASQGSVSGSPPAAAASEGGGASGREPRPQREESQTENTLCRYVERGHTTWSLGTRTVCSQSQITHQAGVKSERGPGCGRTPRSPIIAARGWHGKGPQVGPHSGQWKPHAAFVRRSTDASTWEQGLWFSVFL